jgi:hypothetical protein
MLGIVGAKANPTGKTDSEETRSFSFALSPLDVEFLRVVMMIEQSRRKRARVLGFFCWWRLFWMLTDQTGITKLSLLIFLFRRRLSPNGSLTVSVVSKSAPAFGQRTDQALLGLSQRMSSQSFIY